MTKFVGWRFSKGVYTPEDGSGRSIDYDNINLHTYTDDDPDVHGCCVSVLKIKRGQIGKLLNILPTDSEIESCLNQHLDQPIELVYVPVNGRVVLSKIRFSSSPTSKS